jgi:hypothetical protein
MISQKSGNGCVICYQYIQRFCGNGCICCVKSLATNALSAINTFNGFMVTDVSVASKVTQGEPQGVNT